MALGTRRKRGLYTFPPSLVLGVTPKKLGAQASDLILGVVCAALPGAVDCKGLPLAHRVEVPGLGPREEAIVLRIPSLSVSDNVQREKRKKEFWPVFGMDRRRRNPVVRVAFIG